MKVRLVLAAALCSAVVTNLPATAAAHDGFLAAETGGPCSFVSATDPGTSTGEVQTGSMWGGPVMAAGTLACTIQVAGESHLDPDDAVATSSGSGPVVLMPTVVSFVASAHIPVYLCAQFTSINGATSYWDAQYGAWSSNAGASCGLSLTLEFVPWAVGLAVDEFLCPVLAPLFPPYGDIVGVYRCPSYESGAGAATIGDS